MGYNYFGGLGIVEKAVKTVTNSEKAKHSFVDALLTHCSKPVRFDNSQQKVLPFLFEDFL